MGGPEESPLARVELPSGTKIAKLINELIPNTEGLVADGGFVYARTTNDVEIYGIELFFLRNLFVFSNVSADISIPFEPPVRNLPMPMDGTLTPGDLLAGTIDAPGEVDVVTLAGQTNDRIVLTLVETTDWGGFLGANDVQATLFAPSGAELEVFESDSQQQFTLAETGVYVIQVNANNLVSTGSYTLGLERLDPVGPLDGTLTPGDLLAGAIDAPGEVDVVTLAGQTNDRIVLTLVETTDWGGFLGTNDAQATLFAPSGAELEVFESDSQQQFTLAETGVYVIQVNANNLVSAGSYTLGLERLHPLGPLDGTLTPGNLLAGAIDAPGKVDVVTLAGQTNDRIVLTLVETTNWGGSFGANDVQVTLFAPSGAELGVFDSDSQQQFTLAESGVYVIQVNANNLVSIGSYAVGLERLHPVGPLDGTLTVGDLLAGAIDAPGEVDVVTLTGQTNDIIVVTLVETGANDVHARLIAPSGAELGVFADVGQQFTLGETGVYIIQVSTNDLISTGSYTLGLERLDAACSASRPCFTDVTAQAGLLQGPPPDGLPFAQVTDVMTGAAAAGDIDNDGNVDLYVSRIDALDSLYRNKGDGTFEDIATASGINRGSNSNGAAFGDIDNDGDLDLYVSSAERGTQTRFYLYVNDGRGNFSEEAISRGAAIAGADAHQGWSVAFGDYDSDGYLDIHVCEWRLDSLNSSAALSNSRLLRNLGSANPGAFEDVTVEAGVALDAVQGKLRDPQRGTFSFSSNIVDMDGDSHPDLIIAADFGESRLFWNNGDGTFTDGTAAAGVGLDENGMGSAVGDINGDGLLDWFVTSISGGLLPPYTGNFMYLNNGDRTFTDYTEAAGVRDGFWGWGATFLDYDNDGDLDLTMVNGFPNSVFSLISCCNPMRFWENDGSGHFTEISLSVGLLDAR